VGIEFFNYTPYIVPLTLLALVIALGSLSYLAWRRRRIEPVALGIAAVSAVVIGKFAMDWPPLVYAGIAVLFVTSLIPWRSKARDCCR
jgi:mercuric ion transport protein